MQIHELNTYTGTPGEGDWLAIDNGEKTNKVEANKLGITTPMTATEARAGTVTEQRVISPKTLNDMIDESVLTLYRSIGWIPD